MTDAENNLTLFFKSYFYIIIVPARILRKVLAVEIYSYPPFEQLGSVHFVKRKAQRIIGTNIDIFVQYYYDIILLSCDFSVRSGCLTVSSCKRIEAFGMSV